MKCFKEIIYFKFLDNELRTEDRKRVLIHLQECGRCKKIVKSIEEENLKIKKIFETDRNPPNLVPVIMSKIITPESQYLKEKKSLSFLIYGIFILMGILAPYFLSIYLKSISLFQNFFSSILNPYFFISNIGVFIFRKIVFINAEELTKIVLGQVFLMILFIIILSGYLIKKKILLMEEYK